MLNITEDQKLRFKNILNKEFTGAVKFINITVLNDIPDIIEYLLVNNTSFNTLINFDGIYELVPEGFATNGGYKLKEAIYCNKNIEHITIAIVAKNELDILKQLVYLKTKLITFAITKQVRLAIGNNVNILTSDKDSVLYKKISSKYIVDTTFKYFSELFIV